MLCLALYVVTYRFSTCEQLPDFGITPLMWREAVCFLHVPVFFQPVLVIFFLVSFLVRVMFYRH